MMKHLPVDTHSMYQPTACRLHQGSKTQFWDPESTSPCSNRTVHFFINKLQDILPPAEGSARADVHA